MQAKVVPEVKGAPAAPPLVTVFVCANCARSGLVPTSAGRPRPTPPRFDWPYAVREILVPCAGRLQPEHLLRPFEAGADAVAVVACEEENCHHVEGSRRAARRLEFVTRMLGEIGLGGERLMLFHLPGSAREDMALGEGAAGAAPPADLPDRIRAIRDAVVERVKILTRNPMRGPEAPVEVTEPPEEQEIEDNDE